ncbi:MAG: hypothetical protein ACXVCP_00295 [Bdellovibrio sp.]
MIKEELEKLKFKFKDEHFMACEDFNLGFDTAVNILFPRLEMAIRFLTILDNELNVSATGLSIYKNEGTHRSIKEAIRDLKGSQE